MKALLLVFIIAVIVVAFFVIGMALTQIIKKRALQSEVGENDEMIKRGLSCAKQQFLKEEAEIRGVSDNSFEACGGSCGSCSDSCNDHNGKNDSENDKITE